MSTSAGASASPNAPPRRLPPLERVFPGVFYGWVVVGGAAMLSFVAIGVGFYVQTILLDALVSERGWSKSSVSGASSLYFVVSGIGGTLVGRVIDRGGLRGVIVLGALTLGAALFWIGRVEETRQLFPVYLAMAAGFAMAGSVPINAIITRWFVRLRARAMTFSQTGVSCGGIVVVPLAIWLIQTRGLEFATGFLAILVVAVAIPVSLFVLRSDPRPYGLEPDGGAPRRAGNPLLSAERQARVWRAREALGTPTFWVLALAFGGVLFSQMGCLIHELSLLREHMDAATASLAISTTAGASVIGRFIVGGAIADRVDKRRLGVALFLVQACGVLGLSLATRTGSLYLAAACLGVTIGNIFMLQSLLVGELFGIPSFGTVYGMLLLLTQLAGGLGPYCLGLLYEAWGGYARPLQLFACVSVAAAAALLCVRPPRARPQTIHAADGMRTPSGVV